MNPFVFRTALPFGYLGFWGGMTALAVVGCVLLVGGVRASRRGRAVVGGCMLAGIASVIWINVTAERDLDLNPVIHDRREIAGRWSDRAGALDLRSDGTYACRGDGACADLGAGGTWIWSDFEIAFRPINGIAAVRRLVRYRHELRLTRLGDPDVWDGHLSFRRTPSEG